MNPYKIKEWLECAIALVILAGLIAIGLHLRGWLRGIDHLQEQAQDTAGSIATAADTSNKASTEMLDTIGTLNYVTLPTVTKLVDGIGETNRHAGETISALSGTVSATNSAIGKLGETADAATRRLDSLQSEQDRADALIAAYATIPPRVNAALAPLPELQLSLARTSDSAAAFLSGPASTLATKAGDLSGNAAAMTGHIDSKFFAPWDGSHPFRHRVGQALKFAIGLAEPAYYSVGILHGQ